MTRKILLSFIVSAFVLTTHAQSKSKSTTAYAITAPEKGNGNWTEVRLIDVSTGEVIKTIYQSAEKAQALNARTKNAVMQKPATSQQTILGNMFVHSSTIKPTNQAPRSIELKELNGITDVDIAKALEGKLQSLTFEKRKPSSNVHDTYNFNHKPDIQEFRVRGFSRKQQNEGPFATNSAACAYDKKHDRLYYTPMGINQLRYIDLKSATPTVYYFEDETFGNVKGNWDVKNQITRMVIGADGNGYALSNDGDHLIRFATKKKMEITDLGAVMDDPTNGDHSIHSNHGFGGDMIAGEKGNLYLITANRAVFEITLENKVATYKGMITGLPRGYSTNGAAVEAGTKVIVSSANSTLGYYRFDMQTLIAEKVSSNENVFNASDLANGNLLADKKKKKNELAATTQIPLLAERKVSSDVSSGMAKLSVYPNPVTNGAVKLLFGDYAKGRYQVQFIDITGKLMQAQSINISNKMQVQEFALPSLMGKGNYVIKVMGETSKVINVAQLVVQ